MSVFSLYLIQSLVCPVARLSCRSSVLSLVCPIACLSYYLSILLLIYLITYLFYYLSILSICIGSYLASRRLLVASPLAGRSGYRPTLEL
jgi:hypothetical protein